MRDVQRSWLLFLALAVAAPITLGTLGCGKDDAASSAQEASEETGAAQVEGADEEADEDEASEEEAPAEAEGDEETPAAAPAKPDPTAKRVTGKEASPKATPRGDKARDRVKEAREKGKSEVADAPKQGDEQAEAAAPKTPPTPALEGAEQPDKADALLSPAERRKVERERRIAELKRRNEERRKERMAKVDDQRREAEAEAQAKASNEAAVARVAPKAPAVKALSLKKYINQADLRKLLSNDTLVEEGPLVGIAPSESYNSLYYAPPVRSSFGVSVQLWRDKTRRDANVRFRRMRAQYANAEDTTAPSAKSFVSQWDDILTLTFANLTKRIVVSVSCSTKLCKPAQLLAVAKSISDKL